MWRSALLTAILFNAHPATNAQDVLPLFGEPTRMWTSEMNGSSNGFCLDTWRSTNWIAGDTAINGTAYTKLLWRTRHYLTPIIDPCFDMQEYWQPNIHVREVDGKVYALNMSETIETLIYDFTAEVGDSVPPPCGPECSWGGGAWATVLAKDSVLIDGSYRTRWNVNSVWNGPDTVYIIEGIGSTTGLFNPLVYTDFETSFLLNCVYENGGAIFSQYDCELINTIDEAKFPTVVPPFPNPCYGELKLDHHVARAEILSIDGRILLSGAYHGQPLHLESPGTVIIRGFDMAGALIGNWCSIVLQR